MLDQVKSKVADVMVQLSELGYPPISIGIEVAPLKKGVAGYAFVNKKRITISSHYLIEHFDTVMSRTVPHEVCHVYVREYFPQAKQFHGPEFRYLMNLLGADSTTKHKMKLSTNETVRKTKTRHIYKTAITKLEVVLTPQQHKKQQAGTICCTYKGEALQYTNQIRQFK